jgi:hypothetical protein
MVRGHLRPALYFAAILSSGMDLIFEAMPAQPNCS